ncbi:rifin [Plasmodium sp. gorilla clade G1]|nr:rifin [Plasmodium sp. gorilla clade G1]
MKLCYYKILLFSLALNILISSSYEHNNNKSYITPHTPTNTSRVLRECDIYMPNYDNDADMKSVKEKFDRQTSQRFEENEERMQEKRQKCKEQCEKDIQKIILKDQIEKSLGEKVEKVEKVCLRCGFGLGGVAAGVGIFGAIAVSEVKKAALLAAEKAGVDAGISEAIKLITSKFSLTTLGGRTLEKVVNAQTFKNPMFYVFRIQNEYDNICSVNPKINNLLCSYTKPNMPLTYEAISTSASDIALKAGEAAKTAEKAEIALANTESTYLYSAIGYSVLVIFIILLVMVIIYLVLRYRRKKKMNKKLQYTKLLNQ